MRSSSLPSYHTFSYLLAPFANLFLVEACLNIATAHNAEAYHRMPSEEGGEEEKPRVRDDEIDAPDKSDVESVKGSDDGVEDGRDYFLANGGLAADDAFAVAIARSKECQCTTNTPSFHPTHRNHKNLPGIREGRDTKSHLHAKASYQFRPHTHTQARTVVPKGLARKNIK